MVELRIDVKGGGLNWCKEIIRGEWREGESGGEGGVGACISFSCF